MTVLIYVDTSKQVGDKDHLKVFANQDAAETWFQALEVLKDECSQTRGNQLRDNREAIDVVESDLEGLVVALAVLSIGSPTAPSAQPKLEPERRRDRAPEAQASKQ